MWLSGPPGIKGCPKALRKTICWHVNKNGARVTSHLHAVPSSRWVLAGALSWRPGAGIDDPCGSSSAHRVIGSWNILILMGSQGWKKQGGHSEWWIPKPECFPKAKSYLWCWRLLSSPNICFELRAKAYRKMLTCWSESRGDHRDA